MPVLVLNAGSSTQKCCLFDAADTVLWRAQADWTQSPGRVVVCISTANGSGQEVVLDETGRQAVLTWILATLWQGENPVIRDLKAITVVGHRVVHGGDHLRSSLRITPQIKADVRALAALAPLHNPAHAEGMDAAEAILGPGIPQIAVFDTAFHQTLSPAAITYPIPQAWTAQGIRRYGFHGISHRYVAERAGILLGQDWTTLKLITCHLGNGCSLAAIDQGRSVDTTMGFTPLDGIMMGTRPGSLDPGILLSMLRHGLSLDDLDHLLNQECGLKGVSGGSADLRQVLAAQQSDDPDQKALATLALEVYIHRLRAGIGAMLAALGGLDVLVFTAGVGENSPLIRAQACERWACLGLELDPEQNQATSPSDRVISRQGSRVQVVVIHTQEDLAIAQECRRIMANP